MTESSSVIQAHPDINSLGSGILLAMILLFTALLAAAYDAPADSLWLRFVLTFILLATLVYFLEGITEELRFENGVVTFRAWFKPAPAVELRQVEQIFFVHEGLNLEHGIETLTFQRFDGSRVRFRLGPLWHRHLVLKFLRELEQRAGKSLLIEKA